MKKITLKIWIYATTFLIEALTFNVALAFAIVALVFVKSGLTVWAIIAIATSSTWILQIFIKHLIWFLMSKMERALYLTIRKHGRKMINITSKELSATGQSDIHEVLTDVDNGLEIQMLINGAGTFINTYIGIKWFIHARKFHLNETKFEYNIN